jgi:hypothetical protein
MVGVMKEFLIATPASRMAITMQAIPFFDDWSF